MVFLPEGGGPEPDLKTLSSMAAALPVHDEARVKESKEEFSFLNV